MIQAFHSAVARRRAAAGGNGLLNGLLHWWNLDETSGNAIAQEGGVDLTDTNTVTYTAAGAPDGGNCRLFTPANSEYFSASAGSVWNSGTTMSFSIWTNVTSSGTAKFVFAHAAPNGASSFNFTATNNYSYLLFDGLNSVIPSNSGAGAWNNYTITTTGPGGSDKLYKNGSQIGSTGTQGWEPGSAIWYLGRAITNVQFFNGEMASCGIWDRVLSADDITALYNAGVNLRYADLTS